MPYEIKIDDEIKAIEILNLDGNLLHVKIGERTYQLDIVEVEEGIYSITLDGKSFNVDLASIGNKKYQVNTLYNSMDVEVIDAESKYLNSRKSHEDEEQSFISTPMPGKVVKILVKEGQKVTAGETLIVVSAMKMESEYKVSSDRTVREILVAEGDSIDGNQPLITLE
ncbi:MAG: biotin/lipoyl-binding protein [bacterium]